MNILSCVCLLLAIVFGMVSAPRYGEILAVSIVLSLAATTAAVLAYRRATRNWGRVVATGVIILASVMIFQALLRLLFGVRITDFLG